MAAPAYARTAASTDDDDDDPYAPTPEDKQRAQLLREAWDAYDGRFRGGDTQWPLKWEVGVEHNPNVLMNRCGPAASIDVAWLMGEQVVIALPEANKDAQEYADTVWGVSSDESSDDDKMGLLLKLATFGAINGNAYLKIVWDDAKMDTPELVEIDPRHVRVQTDPHNVNLIVCYVVEYPMPDPMRPHDPFGMFRQVIELVDPDGDVTRDGTFASDDDATWLISEYFRAHNQRRFVPTDKKPVPWPYSWAPIDGCPHIARPGYRYGRGRITPDAIRVNEAICTLASDIMKIGLTHGHPVLFTVTPGSNTKTIKYEPGTILQVSSKVEAVQAHGDIPGLLAYASRLDTAFEECTHIPALAFGRTLDKRSGPVSGESIKQDFQALLADINMERRSYGSFIRRVTQHTMELRNPEWKDLPVTLTWPDPIPTNIQQASMLITAAVPVGVMSKQSAAEKYLKLDWATEQDNMQEEAQDKMAAIAHGQALPQPPSAPQPGAPQRTERADRQSQSEKRTQW